jgi:hypothetical protein
MKSSRQWPDAATCPGTGFFYSFVRQHKCHSAHPRAVPRISHSLSLEMHTSGLEHPLIEPPHTTGRTADEDKRVRL